MEGSVAFCKFSRVVTALHDYSWRDGASESLARWILRVASTLVTPVLH
jgi:hypothetical protein